MDTAIADAETTKHPAFGRIIMLLCAILIPFSLSAVLSGLFYQLGDYTVKPLTQAKTAYASITYPGRTNVVGTTFTARGTLGKLPENTTAYLMAKRDERYWPKKYLGTQPGKWSQDMTEVIRSGNKLYLVVLALSPEDKQRVEQWQTTSSQTGQYPGMTEFSLEQEIAAVEVKQQ